MKGIYVRSFFHIAETRSYQLQELTLSVLPNFVEAMDYSVFKNSVFPRICSLCLETGTLFFSSFTFENSDNLLINGENNIMCRLSLCTGEESCVSQQTLQRARQVDCS